jgi:hypothetical protein
LESSIFCPFSASLLRGDHDDVNIADPDNWDLIHPEVI